MDDRGFIFTADASLALIVIMIVGASITTYLMAPYSMGQDHEHLQALASDTLETMEQDGTLTLAAVKYSQGDTSGGDQILNERLSLLIPADTGYNLTMFGRSVGNDSRILVASDTATAVRVISGPKEGYLGRAWYKQEEVNLTDQQIEVNSTVWNFHNWLTNFDPWSTQGFYNRQYWGVSGNSRPGTPVSIPFSIPGDATVLGAFFLQGSNNESATSLTASSYGVTVNINGVNYANTTPFTFLYPRVNSYGSIQNGLVYNYKGTITNLQPGSNTFYVNFNNLTGSYNRYGQFSAYDYDMPWFSIIADYMTTIKVPVGILSSNYSLPDAAGLARSNNAAGDYGKIYNLSSGTVTSLTTSRSMNWNYFATNRNLLDNYDDGIPFVITNVPHVSGTGAGSAVSVVQDVDIPDNTRIMDAYVNLNAYAAVDGALVEVWDGTSWQTAFCSFNFDSITNANANTDGYGNVPGIIYIGDKLHTGHNKVRVTVWDDVPSNDYDLVGIVGSKVYVSYTSLPIKWDTFAFDSYQAGSVNTYTFPNSNGRSFTIGADATKVYLFVGAGTTSRHIKVEVRKSTSSTWYKLYDDDAIPYSLDLGELDASKNLHILTTGTSSNYTLNQGTYYSRVTITSPYSWQSGDDGSTYGNPTIFSGTRIAVIYPKFLQNIWATSYNSTADAAKDQAKSDLIAYLDQNGIIVDPSTIQTEALYTGNLPNAISVRLDLWK